MHCVEEVALRKESVDRNSIGPLIFNVQPVALRKESVDRNQLDELPRRFLLESLSARRAWIEIQNHLLRTIPRIVALRKESVDRNITRYMGSISGNRRSPQGERG